MKSILLIATVSLSVAFNLRAENAPEKPVEVKAEAKASDHDEHAGHDHSSHGSPSGISKNGITPLANTNKVVFTNLAQKASYVIGVMNAAGAMLDTEDLLQPEMVLMGMRDVFYNYIPLVGPDEAEDVRKEFDQLVRKRQENKVKQEAEDNKTKGLAFLEQNKKKDGVVVTPSGLQYKIGTEGKGQSPTENDKVAIFFKSRNVDGIEFSNNYKHKQPSVTPLKFLPKGLQEALVKMKPGAKWEVYVPSELAYGTREVGKGVGPNSTIIFELELVDVIKEKADAK